LFLFHSWRLLTKTATDVYKIESFGWWKILRHLWSETLKDISSKVK
jgi:hypothetical protein